MHNLKPRLLVAVFFAASSSFLLGQGAPDIVWSGPGHIGIGSLAVSPDGSTLATTSFVDYTIKLWDAADGRLLHTLQGSPNGVEAVTFSPDGTTVASAGESASEPNIKLWRVSDGAFLRDFIAPANSIAYSIEFSADGNYLAVADQTQGVQLWKVATGEYLNTSGTYRNGFLALDLITDRRTSIRLPKQGTVATGNGDGSIQLSIFPSGRAFEALIGHTSLVDAVAFGRRGSMLGSGSYDATARLWDLASGTTTHILSGHKAAVTSVKFNPDSSRFATASSDGTIKLWEPDTGALLRTLTDPSTAGESIGFSPDGATLYSGGSDGRLRFWNPGTGVLLRKIGHHGSGVNTVSFSSDGTLFASGAFDIQLWDAGTGAPGRTFNLQTDIINSIAVSHNGKTLASGSGLPPPDTRDHRVLLYRVADGALLLDLPGHSGGTRGVDISPDQKNIVSVGWDRSIKYWRVADGMLLRTVTGHTKQVNDVSYSPDGQLVASGGGDGTVRIWLSSDGSPVRTIFTHEIQSVTHVAFSPDSKLIAASEEGYGSNVEIWQVATGALLHTLPGDPGSFSQSVAFSNDSTELASTSGYTFEIRFWDVATGSLLRRYDAETGGGIQHSLPIKFQPGGSFFGYGRADSTVIMATSPLARGLENRR